jgi:hypothetical protein
MDYDGSRSSASALLSRSLLLPERLLLELESRRELLELLEHALSLCSQTERELAELFRSFSLIGLLMELFRERANLRDLNNGVVSLMHSGVGNKAISIFDEISSG